MFGIGIPELILIFVVGLIVFGPNQLPELGRTLGKGLREFRKASSALSNTLNEPTPPTNNANKPANSNVISEVAHNDDSLDSPIDTNAAFKAEVENSSYDERHNKDNINNGNKGEVTPIAIVDKPFSTDLFKDMPSTPKASSEVVSESEVK